MSEKIEKKIRCHFMIDPGDLEIINKIKHKERVTQGAVIRKMIKYYLDKELGGKNGNGRNHHSRRKGTES